MTNPEKIKISLMILPIIFFSSISIVNANYDSLYEYNSIYKYNALENKTYFPTTINNTETIEEKLPEINPVIENNIEKLKNITNKQIDSIEKSDKAISRIENRSDLRTFILGNKLGILKYQMVQMQDQSYVLNALALDTKDTEKENQINNQVNILELQQTKVENFILEQENEFSLLGWFVGSL
jgi:hypothetical protein